MTDIDVRQVFDNIGEIIFDIESEITEMVDENTASKGIIGRLIKLEKDAQSLQKCVYKEFYKDEVL
jgi:hypothetical protein